MAENTGQEQTERIEDRRRPPFCFQTHATLDAIREHFTGAKRATAIAVYVCLTEAANRNGGAPARDGFRAARKEIAQLAGVSVDTLDRYVAEFEQIGVLAVERSKIGDVNLPNSWALVDPPGAPPSRTRAATPSRTRAALRAREDGPKAKKENLEEKVIAARKANQPFDALVEVCPGVNAKADGGLVARALKTIRVRLEAEASGKQAISESDRVCATAALAADGDPLGNAVLADEIRRRAKLYVERFSDEIVLSPGALAKNWTVVIVPRRRKGAFVPGAAAHDDPDLALYDRNIRRRGA